LNRGGHFVVGELQIMQPSICSGPRDQFRVRSHFANLAFFQYQNFVGAPDGRQPMRNYECRSSNH
jgi:hypothetical protein